MNTLTSPFLDEESLELEHFPQDELSFSKQIDSPFLTSELFAEDELENELTPFEEEFDKDEFDNEYHNDLFIEELETEDDEDEIEDEQISITDNSYSEMEILEHEGHPEMYNVETSLEIEDQEEGFQDDANEDEIEGYSQDYYFEDFVDENEYDEGDLDEDLESISSEENNLVESFIPASKLSWQGASNEQLGFMKKVYKVHIARASNRRKFMPSLPDNKRGSVEGSWLRIDAANALRGLLQDVRQEISRLNKNITIKIASGYRSADRQFALWPQRFQNYYKRTQEHRSKLPDGKHGVQAVNYMVNYISVRFAAPGFSLHQSGTAVDLQPIENGKRYLNKTTGIHRNNWQKTWFWSWLIKNAATYGFYQNTKIKEPWHWEYNANNGGDNSGHEPVHSKNTTNNDFFGDIIQKGKDAASSFLQTGNLISIAKDAISRGERDENKITNDVFYSKYPSEKEKKLKPGDPLIKEWLSMRKNIVRPLLNDLKNTQKSRGENTLAKPNNSGASPKTSIHPKIIKYQKHYMYAKPGALTKEREGMHHRPEVPKGLGNKSGVTLGVGIDLTALIRKKGGERGRIELVNAIAKNNIAQAKWIMGVPNNIRGAIASQWLKNHPMPGDGFTTIQLNQLYRFGRRIFDHRAKLRLLGKTGYPIADADPPLTLNAYNNLALDPAHPDDDYLLELLADLAWNSAHFAKGRQNKIVRALSAVNVKGDRYERQIAQLGNLRDFIAKGKFGGTEGRFRRLGWINAKITQLKADRGSKWDL